MFSILKRDIIKILEILKLYKFDLKFYICTIFSLIYLKKIVIFFFFMIIVSNLIFCLRMFISKRIIMYKSSNFLFYSYQKHSFFFIKNISNSRKKSNFISLFIIRYIITFLLSISLKTIYVLLSIYHIIYKEIEYSEIKDKDVILYITFIKRVFYTILNESILSNPKLVDKNYELFFFNNKWTILFIN